MEHTFGAWYSWESKTTEGRHETSVSAGCVSENSQHNNDTPFAAPFQDYTHILL